MLLDSVVHTDHGILDLLWEADGYWDGNIDLFFAGQTNGLVGASNPRGVFVSLARMSGGSRVTVQLHDDKPELDTDAWEDVVEVSTIVPEGTAPTWQTFAGRRVGPLDLDPGPYRLRVSARGRDETRPGLLTDESVQEVVDFYLIDAWASPVAPDAVLQTVSYNAAGRHSLVSGHWDEEPGGEAAAVMRTTSLTAQRTAHRTQMTIWERLREWIGTIWKGVHRSAWGRTRRAARADRT